MNIDDKLLDDFKDCVKSAVAQHYKKSGVIARQRLLWRLTKHWNSRPMQIGIPGTVRKQIGEDNATKLFKDIANEIIYNPELLNNAITEHKQFIEEFNHQLFDDNRSTKPTTRANQLLDPYLNNQNINVDLLTVLIDTLINAGYECRVFEDIDHVIGIGVKGIGNIYANSSPVIIEAVIGGYDPSKTVSDDFEKLIDKLNKQFKYIECTVEHIPKYDYDGLDDQSDASIMQNLTTLTDFMNSKSLAVVYSETIIRIRTTISKFTKDDTERILKLLRLWANEIELLHKSLFAYTFETDDKELFLKACNEVIGIGKASTALLQRRLQISYAKADQLMNEMEQRHIIKRHTDKPSEILVNSISDCQW